MVEYAPPTAPHAATPIQPPVLHLSGRGRRHSGRWHTAGAVHEIRCLTAFCIFGIRAAATGGLQAKRLPANMPGWTIENEDIAATTMTINTQRFKKLAIQKAKILESNIFFARELKEKHFDPTWHAHDEYQLFLVVRGTGTRFIGNTVKQFGAGDLTFLGPNMPHLWRSDETYFDVNTDDSSHGLVVYFHKDALTPFMDKEEMAQVKALFEKLAYGLEITGKTVGTIRQLMADLVHLHGIESIIQFFKILDMLAHTKDYHLLHNQAYTYLLKEEETNRINLVYNYVARNFRNPILIEEPASLLNMTPSSFSRYFRMKTSKSFSNFLTEVRIRNACNLLSIAETKSIAQICYESGFNTLSNFNKQFKAVMGITPKEYRRMFQTL